jgi:hypothetical protein
LLRAEMKAFFLIYLYIIFRCENFGQVAGKLIDHLSEHCNCKNLDPPTTTCRGNCFILNHAYFQLA